MSNVTLTFRQRVGENNQLFGSVTAKDIADALEAQKYHIDRRKVQLEEPIRTLGEHKVTLAAAPRRSDRHQGDRGSRAVTALVSRSRQTQRGDSGRGAGRGFARPPRPGSSLSSRAPRPARAEALPAVVAFAERDRQHDVVDLAPN